MGKIAGVLKEQLLTGGYAKSVEVETDSDNLVELRVVALPKWNEDHTNLKRLRLTHREFWITIGSPSWLDAQTSNFEVFRLIFSRKVHQFRDPTLYRLAMVERLLLAVAIVAMFFYLYYHFVHR